MHDNAATIESFYSAFDERDFAAMAACYHKNVHFTDPVFGDLRGAEAAAMWHMLCDQAADLAVTVAGVAADDTSGSARWEATYTFGPTGRKVHNRIDAAFEFSDGKIIRHIDTFNLWKWMRMAAGLPGALAGWSGSAQNKVRSTARKNLDRFLAEHPEYDAD
ncbi:MAG: nuclear transport factor 2 family protein [Armatimonadetes bacterium]|nr:MAG: nuclear transport factor 2 family protein [Armatimonadota bacterium]